jgi:hypothetical protein
MVHWIPKELDTHCRVDWFRQRDGVLTDPVDTDILCVELDFRPYACMSDWETLFAAAVVLQDFISAARRLGLLAKLEASVDPSSGSEHACKVAGLCESPVTSMDAST